MDGKVIRGTIDTEASDGLCCWLHICQGRNNSGQVAIESKQMKSPLH